MNEIIDVIENYIKKQFKISNVTDTQTQTKILDRIKKQYINKDIDFKSKIKFKRIISLGKKRSVAYFGDKFCLEYYLVKYFVHDIKDMQNKGLANMKVPTQKILNYLDKSIKNDHFTIIRFDFKNYYNNLSSEYIYDKFIKYFKLKDTERYFLEQYVKQVPYCFAGLSEMPYVFIMAMILTFL